MSTDLFGKFYALLPWATPPFLLGPLGTGDWKTAFIPLFSLGFGLLIYLPFWKLYLAKLDERDALQAQADLEKGITNSSVIEA
jgi:PTS system cellobiose-specific IIC component